MSNKKGASDRKSKQTTLAHSKKILSIISKVIASSLLIGGIYYFGLYVNNMMKDVNENQISHVVVEGTLTHVSPTDIESSVLGFLSESLIGIDIERIKSQIQSNEWIKEVDIKREWPDTLIIYVKEEVAIAHWGDKQYLNDAGHIFTPTNLVVQSSLPYLYGPIGSEKMVMRQYQQISQIMYRNGQKIINLEMNERGAWDLQLDNGIKVKIGKEKIDQKIRRLMSVIGYFFEDELSSIVSIDLRYKNGIAVNKLLIREGMVSL